MEQRRGAMGQETAKEVLVVTDNPETQDALARIPSAEGYALDGAADG
jgi:DNA-binding response OmpR family regulator